MNFHDRQFYASGYSQSNPKDYGRFGAQKRSMSKTIFVVFGLCFVSTLVYLNRDKLEDELQGLHKLSSQVEQFISRI